MAGDYWKMVSNQLVGWTIWWWILEETDGICSMRGLNHVIDNEGDWWWLAKWEGWTLWWWIIKENDGICSVRGLNHVIDNEGDWWCLVGCSLQGINALCLMDIKPCVSFTKLGTVVLYLGVFFIGKNKKLKISWLKWWNIIRSSDFSYFFLFCRAQVKVQVQVRSRSGRSELDLTLTIFLVFTTTHPPTHPPQTWVGLTQVGSEEVRTSRWTPRQRSSGTTGGTSGSTSMSLILCDSFMKS